MKGHFIRYTIVIILLISAILMSPLFIAHETYIKFFDHIDEELNMNIEMMLSKYGFFSMIVVVGLMVIAHIL